MAKSESRSYREVPNLAGSNSCQDQKVDFQVAILEARSRSAFVVGVTRLAERACNLEKRYD